jgi:hypothetical protein
MKTNQIIINALKAWDNYTLDSNLKNSDGFCPVTDIRRDKSAVYFRLFGRTNCTITTYHHGYCDLYFGSEHPISFAK